MTHSITRIIPASHHGGKLEHDTANSMDFKLERRGTKWAMVPERGQTVFFDQPGGRAMAYIRAASIRFNVSAPWLERVLNPE